MLTNNLNLKFSGHTRFIALLISGLILTLSSCLPKRDIQRPAEKAPPRTVSTTTHSSQPGTSLAGNEYINRFKDIAMEEMKRHGIPASIKLAQGILESGNGNSQLARRSNNHFGIKCTSDWSGGRTYHDDDRENDCFRVYRLPEESFRDHSQFLLRRRYEKLFKLDPRDYRGWARGLKEAGYATNPRYADLLIDLIERYELYQYDDPTAIRQTYVSFPEPAIQEQQPVTMTIHEVAAGETLADISKRYGLSSDEILLMNGLKSQDLHPGQLLVVSKK